MKGFVSIPAADGPQHPQGGRYGVALPFHGELDDVLRVKVLRAGCKGGTCGVLDALVDGEYG
jgi:hypothetical protein